MKLVPMVLAVCAGSLVTLGALANPPAAPAPVAPAPAASAPAKEAPRPLAKPEIAAIAKTVMSARDLNWVSPGAYASTPAFKPKEVKVIVSKAEPVAAPKGLGDAKAYRFKASFVTPARQRLEDGSWKIIRTSRWQVEGTMIHPAGQEGAKPGEPVISGQHLVIKNPSYLHDHTDLEESKKVGIPEHAWLEAELAVIEHGDPNAKKITNPQLQAMAQRLKQIDADHASGKLNDEEYVAESSDTRREAVELATKIQLGMPLDEKIAPYSLLSAPR